MAMDPIVKLRGLIWDKSAKVFTDEELQEYMADCGNNVYRTAAHCLNIIRANPEKLTQLNLGGMSMTYQDLDAAIKMYKQTAGSQGIQSVSMERSYCNETSRHCR
jgi:hypothetical protein